MPGRQAAEDLACSHREVLRDAVRAAHRVGADALRRGLVDPRHVLLPLVRAAHGLAEVVVDDGRPVASDSRAIRPSFSPASTPPPDWMMPVPSSRSTSPSAKISFSSAHNAGMWHALRVEMALSARHREAERAGLHAVAHDVLHRLDLVVGRGALLALVAHHVVAHRGVADQLADIDAEVAGRAGPCIAGSSPNRPRRCRSTSIGIAST